MGCFNVLCFGFLAVISTIDCCFLPLLYVVSCYEGRGIKHVPKTLPTPLPSFSIRTLSVYPAAILYTINSVYYQMILKYLCSWDSDHTPLLNITGLIRTPDSYIMVGWWNRVLFDLKRILRQYNGFVIPWLRYCYHLIFFQKHDKYILGINSVEYGVV